jgi:hypothetical protein
MLVGLKPRQKVLRNFQAAYEVMYLVVAQDVVATRSQEPDPYID